MARRRHPADAARLDLSAAGDGICRPHPARHVEDAELLFYIIAGLLWVLPAGAIISWMAKGRRKTEG
ncbi:DUF2842 domain-containing protein [Methylobrevis pamukkalensis]|uniref:DUF2842 domain-containing protein n=1 Tax=Methylobrevis pamukkalensis TaxID=1439726 RepID=UPI0009F69468